MPAKSKAQSKYLNWKFGHSWVKQHGFDTPTAGLPEHLGGKPGKKKKLKRKY